MKKMKSVLVLMLCGALVLSQAGCGGKKTNDTGDKEKVVVTMWDKPASDSKPDEIERYNAKMARLKEALPDIEINDISVNFASDYRQEYDKALMAGNAPTVFTMFSYTDIPARIENGTVREMTEYVADWQLRKDGKVMHNFDEAISKNGKWYAVPRSGYIRGTMYNKTLLKEAGVDVANLPETWEEFTTLGQKVTDFSIPRIGYELIGMDWCAWPFTAWIWSAGGEMVEPNGDGTYKISFNSEKGVDTAMMMNEMIWKYKMTQKDVLQDMGAISMDILTKKACFAFDSITNFSATALSEYGLSYDDFGVMPIPAKSATEGAKSALAGGEVITFNPKAGDEEVAAAWKVIEYLYYDETEVMAQIQDTIDDGNAALDIPARIDLYEKKLSMNSFVPESTIKELAEMAEIAKPEPYCGDWAALKNEIAIPLQRIYLDEGITREEAKALLDDCAEKLYKKYPNSFKK